MKANEESTYKAIKSLFEHADSETMLSLRDEPSWDELLTIYAQSVAEISGRLTGVEIAGFAKIGISISRKRLSLPG